MYEEDDKQHIVVIDDLHRLNRPEAQKELYPVLDRLMGQRNVWLILIARCQVPRWLMPLYIHHVFCVIEEKLVIVPEQLKIVLITVVSKKNGV